MKIWIESDNVSSDIHGQISQMSENYESINSGPNSIVIPSLHFPDGSMSTTQIWTEDKSRLSVTVNFEQNSSATVTRGETQNDQGEQPHPTKCCLLV